MDAFFKESLKKIKRRKIITDSTITQKQPKKRKRKF